MRRIPLVLLLLAGSLSVPIESQQGFGILSETKEPAPIKAGRAPHPGEYVAGFDALSEGFATYFGALFFEHADGEAVFRRMMEENRRQIVASKRNDKPIVDVTEQDLFQLLNTNTYQKAAWVLHMLRGIVGDEKFFDGVRRYYRGHEHGTGLTVDLQRTMEAASGMKLNDFFDQWLFRAYVGQNTSRGYVAEIVMWPWPWRAADHRGRRVIAAT
jgi:hypothetical protein